MEHNKLPELLTAELEDDFQVALYELDEAETIFFTPEGVELVEAIETEETTTRSVLIDDERHDFTVPVYCQQLLGSMTLQAFTQEYLQRRQASEERRAWYTSGLEEPITDPNFLEWKAQLPTSEQIQVAAQKVVEERGDISGEELADCTNCRGAGEHTFDDETHTCSCCSGTGMMRPYPTVHVVNEKTGDYQTVVLDVAQLLADGDIKADTFLRESHWTNLATAEYTVRISTDAYFEKVIASLGIDPKDAATNSTDRYGTWKRYGDTLVNMWWKKDEDGIEAKNRTGSVDITAADIYDLQRCLASHFAWPAVFQQEFEKDPIQARKEALEKYNRVLNEQGNVTETVYSIVQLPPFHEAFNELVQLVAERDRRIAYGMAFIATGERGPSFYVADNNNKLLAQVGLDYDVRHALMGSLKYIHKEISKRR